MNNLFHILVFRDLRSRNHLLPWLTPERGLHLFHYRRSYVIVHLRCPICYIHSTSSTTSSICCPSSNKNSPCQLRVAPKRSRSIACLMVIETMFSYTPCWFKTWFPNPWECIFRNWKKLFLPISLLTQTSPSFVTTLMVWDILKKLWRHMFPNFSYLVIFLKNRLWPIKDYSWENEGVLCS